jgi:hypothetical protein
MRQAAGHRVRIGRQWFPRRQSLKRIMRKTFAATESSSTTPEELDDTDFSGH